MDNSCMGCGKALKSKSSKRCSKCAANFRHHGTDVKPKYICKTCGGEITGRNRARGEYCSRKCVYASPEVMAKLTAPRNSVTKHCPQCDKDFMVPVSTAGRYNYCSTKCRLDAGGVVVSCKRCGSRFRKGRQRKAALLHCSESCRRPATLINCAECKVEFRVVPSAEGTRRFCSKRCYIVHTGETSIERDVRVLLEAWGIDHRPQAQVGPWVVDFMIEDKLIIEADGDYWHSMRPDVDKRKTKDLTSRGYVVQRITETEIRSEHCEDILRRALASVSIHTHDTTATPAAA